jgi:hypothetical protein
MIRLCPAEYMFWAVETVEAKNSSKETLPATSIVVNPRRKSGSAL